MKLRFNPRDRNRSAAVPAAGSCGVPQREQDDGARTRGEPAGEDVSATQSGAPFTLKTSQRGELISALLLVLVIVTLFTLAVLPSLRSRYSEPRNECVVQLKQLDGAKKAWAAKHNKPDDAVPVESDLIGGNGFLKEMPVCPDGGIYRLNAINELPTCSLPGNPHYHVVREPGRIGSKSKAAKK